MVMVSEPSFSVLIPACPITNRVAVGLVVDEQLSFGVVHGQLPVSPHSMDENGQVSIYIVLIVLIVLILLIADPQAIVER
jgi:hypothetical protein